MTDNTEQIREQLQKICRGVLTGRDLLDKNTYLSDIPLAMRDKPLYAFEYDELLQEIHHAVQRATAQRDGEWEQSIKDILFNLGAIRAAPDKHTREEVIAATEGLCDGLLATGSMGERRGR